MRKIANVTLTLTLGGVTVLGLSAEAHAAPTLQAKAHDAAKSKAGSPYRYGAAGPAAFDCSGYTQYAYKQAGRTIPRTAQDQYNAAQKISWKDRKVGDLVAIGTNARAITHVGIYAGYSKGSAWMWNANTGQHRGRKVVLAPIPEYLSGGRQVFYARIK